MRFKFSNNAGIDYNFSTKIISLGFPLSFHAETHQSELSDLNIGSVASKYSKKSGEYSRSSSTIMTYNFNQKMYPKLVFEWLNNFNLNF